MATLFDDKKKTKTHGTVESLVGFMINDLIGATKHKPKDLRRYCEASVRSAIRRNGRTDAKQRLVMSDAERAQWESDNPLPE